MGARWLIAMLLVGGCDVVYGLDGRTAPVVDAAIADAPIDEPLDVIDAPMCPGDYLPVVGAPTTSRYRIVDDPGRRWTYAFDDCRNDTPTGITHLVVFDDTVELASIQGALPVALPSFYAWVGYGRDFGSTPLLFRSVTDVPIDTSSNLWNDGEPDNGGGGPAETVVWIAHNNNGLVDGRYTDPVNGYVCECDFIPTIGIEFHVEP